MIFHTLSKLNISCCFYAWKCLKMRHMQVITGLVQTLKWKLRLSASSLFTFFMTQSNRELSQRDLWQVGVFTKIGKIASTPWISKTWKVAHCRVLCIYVCVNKMHVIQCKYFLFACLICNLKLDFKGTVHDKKKSEIIFKKILLLCLLCSLFTKFDFILSDIVCSGFCLFCCL